MYLLAITNFKTNSFFDQKSSDTSIMRVTVFVSCLLIGICASNSLPNSKVTNFVSENLIVKSTVLVALDAPAFISCELPNENQEVQSCAFETPSKRVLKNGEGGGVVVLGSKGEEVWQKQADRICTLNIESLQQSDLGDYSCIIARSNGATETVRGRVNLRLEGRAPNTRLPSNTIPSHYDITMIVVLEPDFIIDGTFWVETIVTPDFAHDGFFTIHIDYMSIVEESLWLQTDEFTPLTILEHIYDFERQQYIIHYVPPADRTSFPLTVSGQYKGNIVDGLVGNGFYQDSYTDRATGETRYLAATQFETAGARWAFPCMDEPALKATFSVNIGRRSDLISLSNAPLISSDQPVDGYPGYVWDVYDRTAIMSTYLNAFFVGDFAFVTSDPLPNNVLFKTWARPNAIEDNLAEYVKVIGANITQYYGDLFNIPFPLPKQDQIAYPSKGGAMENWGLVTYGETGLLIDQTISGDWDRYRITSVNAHELAHQWFGDLVTTKWWNDIWLNEGFATYISYFGVDVVEPEMQSWNRLYVDEMRSILRSDALPTSVPMLVEVDHPSETNFGSITYNRGATMLRMIEHFLTRDTLFNALRKYLTDFSYSNAVTDDLWFYLNREGHADGTLSQLYDFGTIMDPWFKQMNYPLLTVTRNYATGSVELRQQRFLLQEDTSGDTHNYQWFIPLTYTLVGPGETDFDNTVISRFFLEPNSVLNFGLGVNDLPVVFNIQSVGYYRVNYDAENWDRISEFLLTGDFADMHEVNRAQLLLDTYAFALAGIETYDLPLKIYAYLNRETDYVPLSTAIYVFQQLNGMGTLPPAGQQLRDNLLAELSARFDVVGVAEDLGATFQQNVYQKELVTAVCNIDLPNCVAEATAMFAQWMQTPNPENPANNPVNKQIKASVYCTSIRNGGQAEFDFLQDQLAKTFNPQEQSSISSALSCRVGRNLNELNAEESSMQRDGKGDN